jgi:O-antigen/teichoic acid export membrane protein
MFSKFKYLSGSLAAGSSRVIQIMTTLALIPFLVKSLGTQQFAIWMAAGSLMQALAFMDFGIGSALVNRIAGIKHDQLGQPERQSVTNAALLTCIIAGISVVIITVVHLSICALNPQQVSMDLGREEVLFLTSLSLALTLPFFLVFRLRLALSENIVNSVWDAIASLSIFGVIWILLHYSHPLITSVLALGWIPLLVLALNGLALFRRHPVLIPTLKLINRGEMKRLLRSGNSFFFLAIVSAASFSFDSVAALYLLDGTNAAEFIFAQRIAISIQNLLVLSLMPFWPHFHAAVEAGNHSRAFKVMGTAFGLALGCALPPALLILWYGGSISQIWTQGAITLSPAVCVGIATWFPCFAFAAVIGVLMNTPRLVKMQLQLRTACLVICTVGKVGLVQLWGPSGPFWGNIIGFNLTLIVPGIIILSRYFVASAERQDMVFTVVSTNEA